jgi:hypothetical protein
MIRRITDQTELFAARDLRRRITDGQTDLAADWLATTEAKVLAQESGRHIERDEAVAVADACARIGVNRLVAVVNDALVMDEEAYVVGATVDDLYEVSDELTGVNFLLADEAGSLCLLLTTDDFKLIAGPLDFVTRIAGDPTDAREAFLAFAADELEELQSVLLRADSYMDWVGGRT